MPSVGQGRLTCHVRSGDDNDLLRFRIEIHIVGNVFFSCRKLFLDDRVTSLLDVEDIVVGYHRTDIFVGPGCIGKRQQAVQTGYLRGIDLDGGDEIGKLCHQFVVQTGFQNQNLIFRSQNLLFVLLQFLRDVSSALTSVCLRIQSAGTLSLCVFLTSM